MTLTGLLLAFASTLLSAQSSPEKPEWCRPLPRPEYQTLKRVPVTDPWFEVYEVVPGVLAIYEPHQAEETISYLILGKKMALLFDTGMGISDIRKVTGELTQLPIVVLNSHTHNDHVGGNWEFDTVYGMDTDFTRTNAMGSRQDAQDELGPGMICGELPKGFDSKSYATRRGRSRDFYTITTRSISAAARSKFSLHPATHPTRFHCLIALTGCFSPETLTIPRQSGFIGRRPILISMSPR